jgi:hypothetical protein
MTIRKRNNDNKEKVGHAEDAGQEKIKEQERKGELKREEGKKTWKKRKENQQGQGDSEQDKHWKEAQMWEEKA